MGNLLQDLRYGSRMLIRHRAATVIAVVTRVDRIHQGTALRRERDRPDDVRGDFNFTISSRAAGLLYAGAAGDKSGPDGRVAARVVPL
jgi:hypothetical protein